MHAKSPRLVVHGAHSRRRRTTQPICSSGDCQGDEDLRCSNCHLFFINPVSPSVEAQSSLLRTLINISDVPFTPWSVCLEFLVHGSNTGWPRTCPWLASGICSEGQCGQCLAAAAGQHWHVNFCGMYRVRTGRSETLARRLQLLLCGNQRLLLMPELDPAKSLSLPWRRIVGARSVAVSQACCAPSEAPTTVLLVMGRTFMEPDANNVASGTP